MCSSDLYPVTIMLSREGYLKKMTDRVLKKAAALKYKDGDEPFIEFPSANTHELLVFTNKSQVYKCKVVAFEDTKSAQLGSYLPTDLEMEPDETVIWAIDPEDYKAADHCSPAGSVAPSRVRGCAKGHVLEGCHTCMEM